MDEWRGEKFISAIRKVVCVIVDPLNLTKTKNIKKHLHKYIIILNSLPLFPSAVCNNDILTLNALMMWTTQHLGNIYYNYTSN